MTVEDIYELIPEHNEISDPELKRKCAETFLEAIKRGGWEEKGGIEKCPLQVGLLADDCPASGLDHMRKVAAIATRVYDHLGEWLNTIGKCDRDVVIAGALLHDVGKLMSYTLDENGKPANAPDHDMFNHCVWGAYLAKNNGLPDSVVHIILTHSLAQAPEGPRALVTPEARIVKNSDHIAWDSVAVHWPR